MDDSVEMEPICRVGVTNSNGPEQEPLISDRTGQESFQMWLAVRTDEQSDPFVSDTDSLVSFYSATSKSTECQQEDANTERTTSNRTGCQTSVDENVQTEPNKNCLKRLSERVKNKKCRIRTIWLIISWILGIADITTDILFYNSTFSYLKTAGLRDHYLVFLVLSIAIQGVYQILILLYGTYDASMTYLEGSCATLSPKHSRTNEKKLSP